MQVLVAVLLLRANGASYRKKDTEKKLKVLHFRLFSLSLPS
jgi:hypothetical protein